MYSLPTKDFLQYINGELVHGQGRTTQICCPGNGEPVAQVALASKEQAQLALEAARDAFPGWSALTLEELMRDDPAERYHQEQEANMEGMAW